MALRVTVSSSKRDKFSNIVVGSYWSVAEHDGKPAFLKDQEAGGQQVMLFYYDDRTGENTGWWFGQSCEADDFFGFIENEDELPPATGWEAPDGGKDSLGRLTCAPTDWVVELCPRTRVEGNTKTNRPARGHVQHIFDTWDANKDGTISKEEFRSMIQNISPNQWSDAAIDEIFAVADADRNGRLDFTEMLNWVWGEKETHAAFPERILTPEQEYQEMQEVEQAANSLQPGQYYFLIGRKWHVAWLEWVGHQSPPTLQRLQSVRSNCSASPTASLSSPLTLERTQTWTKERPGPIDNTGLFDSDEPGKLGRDIFEHRDYEIISSQEWDLLHSWYGGGPAIKRRAITQPSGSVVVELYGLRLKVYKSSAEDEHKLMIESKTLPVGTFKKHACEVFGLDFGKVRVWDYYNKNKYALLNDDDTSLDDCRLYDDNEILLEEQFPDGSWPEDDVATSPINSLANLLQNIGPTLGGGAVVGSALGGGAAGNVATAGTPLAKGAVGLRNLGNTCFMNSSLQCLSSLPDLREYFVSDTYKDFLNHTAYKTNGKLAEAYAELLKEMWNPHTCEIAPRSFKWQIGRFADQFAGFGQQDSMEFIEYLLDGLKEDLNKVQGPKPFVEMKEADGRGDEEVASEARDGYFTRNNSHIDELFLGFYKSTITCPEPGCGRVSVTFDPYLSVKLSLVSAADERSMNFSVLVVSLSSNATPTWHNVKVPKFGVCSDIVEATSQSAGLSTQDCILTEVYSGRIFKFFDLTDGVDKIRPNDILVLYVLGQPELFHKTSTERWGKQGAAGSQPASGAQASSAMCGILIHQRQVRPSQPSQFFQYAAQRNTPELLGIPLLACVTSRISGKDLIAQIQSELEKFIGSKARGGWELFRAKDSWNLTQTQTRVDSAESDLIIDKRDCFVVDWPEGKELPEIDSLQALLKSRDTGDGQVSTGAVGLQSCFQMFTETDKLPEADAWYCNRCREHREAFKQMEFWTLPPLLVLQLKRFTYGEYSRDRLDTPVDFPLEGLDLRSYGVNATCSASLVYDLAGISIHIGGLGGGHYVAYTRSSENGKWFEFNDASVTEVSSAAVAAERTGAYVLFYIRRDRRPHGWGSPD